MNNLNVRGNNLNPHVFCQKPFSLQRSICSSREVVPSVVVSGREESIVDVLTALLT